MQSMSGVFSMASHWALQYFSEVVMHEQIGCAHLWVFGVSILFSPVFGSKGGGPSFHLSCRGIRLLCRKEHLAIFVARSEMGGGRDSLGGEADFGVFRCEQT